MNRRRVSTNPNWLYKDTKGHQHLLMESLPNELKNCKIDNVKTTMIWEKNYDVQIGKGDDISNRRDWTCYTDGSKSGLRSGSGSVILHLNKVHTKLSYSVGSAEVFQAEISAVLESAKILLDYRVQNCGVDFLVDSQAALMALLNPTTTSDLVRETKRVLNELCSSNNLVMHYIRAHRGWEYNEMADHNANEGAKAVALPENIPTPSKCSRYTIIEDMIKREWVDLWEKEPCRQTKYFVFGPSAARARLLLQNTRESLGRSIRFLTGHAFLKRHNAVVLYDTNDPPGDNSCRLCEDPDMDETPHHIITECDRLSYWRASTLGAYLLDEFPKWDPQSLTKFLSRKEIILLETETDY